MGPVSSLLHATFKTYLYATMKLHGLVLQTILIKVYKDIIACTSTITTQYCIKQRKHGTPHQKASTIAQGAVEAPERQCIF